MYETRYIQNAITALWDYGLVLWFPCLPQNKQMHPLTTRKIEYSAIERIFNRWVWLKYSKSSLNRYENNRINNNNNNNHHILNWKESIYHDDARSEMDSEQFIIQRIDYSETCREFSLILFDCHHQTTHMPHAYICQIMFIVSQIYE